MEKDALQSRLTALDGLRGFAMVLVFLNHINYSFVNSVLNKWIFDWIFSNGVTGVTFLFILSGFLMSSIYPNPSGMQFLQKRYTRIFPLFLSMTVILFLYRLFPHAGIPVFLLLLVFVPFFARGTWKIVKKLPKSFGKNLFRAFVTLQILIGAVYLLWVMRQAPVVFNYQIPVFLREGIIWLVNATLTLPLGNYIPMLDGVYWSLAAEVLFYILYPFILAPMVGGLIPQKRSAKIFFLLCLFPLLGGVEILSHHIFLLSMLQPELFIYFATGITLGYLYKNKHALLLTFSKFFHGKFYLLPIGIFLFLMATVNDLGLMTSSAWGPWIRLLYALPLTFLVALLLDTKNVLAKIFSKRILVFIGTISYSIYLSHALIIHLAERIYKPTNIFTDGLYIICIFAIEVVVASFLFYLLERPYFHHASKVQHAYAEVSVKKLPSLRIMLSGVCAIYVLAIFFAFQSNVNFFSIQLPISKNNFTPLSKDNTIVLRNNKIISVQFQAQQNDLGLLNLQVIHTLQPFKSEEPIVGFSLREKGSSSVYAIAAYSLSKFDSGNQFPFGFPTIPNSKGKWYIAQWSFIQNSSEKLLFDSTSLMAIYPVNKINLIKHPFYLLNFIQQKLLSVFYNRNAQISTVCAIPFFIFTILLGVRGFRIRQMSTASGSRTRDLHVENVTS